MPVQTSIKKMNTFPCKLYNLLENADSLGYSSIISWQRGGKSFRVWKPKELESLILPRHFKQSKYKSFLRQVCIYNLQRITSGMNRGGYAHPFLVKGKPELAKDIRRIPDPKSSSDSPTQSKTIMVTAPPCHLGSKSFFDVRVTPILPQGMPMDRTAREESVNRSGTEITAKDLDVFVDLFDPSSSQSLNALSSEELYFPAVSSSDMEPINVLSEPSPFASNGAEQNMAAAPAPTGSELEPISILPSTDALIAPTQIAAPVPLPAPTPIAASNSDLHRSESTFPRKVFRMLQDVENNKMDHIVSWINNGTAFRVHNQNTFVKQILPLYFDQTLYEVRTSIHSISNDSRIFHSHTINI
jgi:hypothetical protein